MRAHFPRAAAVLLLLALSCDNPERPPHGSAIYELRASATAISNDTQSTCGLMINVPPFTTVPPWSGSASVIAGRWVATTNGVIVAHDTTLTMTFSVTQDANQLLFALGPPLNDTLTGTRILEPRGASTGTWTCLATFPFAANSSLVSHNYRAVPAPTGTWQLNWLPPVD